METSRSRQAWVLSNLDSPFRMVILVCLATILFYFAAKLGVFMILPGGTISPLWPVNALVITVLLLVPRKIWPVLIAAALGAISLADFQNGTQASYVLWLFLGNMVEILIVALGISRAFEGLPRLDTAKALAKYSIIAVILAPFIAAFLGANPSVRGGYWTQWRLWFLSDALAFLTVVPASLSWLRRERGWMQKSRIRYLEAATLFVALTVLGYFLFVTSGSTHSPSLLYPLVPFLLWSALRFGSLGVGTSVIVTTYLSIWGAAHGRGPFAGPDPLNNVLSLQLFLFFAAASFMVLAAVVEEQKQAEKILRESEGRFRLVANKAPVMIWMCGPDKLCSYVNEPWLSFTGRSFEAELGTGWAEGMHPDDRRAAIEAYTQAFDCRQPFTIEYRLQRYDWEYRWILGSGIPRFESDESFAGYIGSAVDVTDRKLAEEALSSLGGRLIEAQEEERRHIARELHDDVSQKLAMLMIELERLASLSSDSSPQLRDSIESLVNRTSEVSGDVHTLSHRLHSSKLELVGLVVTMRSYCQELAGQRDIEIDFTDSNVPNSLPLQISLCQFRILQEALGNAVKHSGVRHFEVRLERVSNDLQLTIRDSGVGFDPLLPMHDRGLGLISMRERANLVKGTLSVVSRPGGGTKIQVRVPIGAEADANHKSASA